VGPGYKRYRPADVDESVPVTQPDGSTVTETMRVRQNTVSEAVGRGLINYKYRLTDNTAFEDTLLIEAGADNKYYQNDIGLSVSMTKKMALKLGYQVRYNSDVQPGTQSTDSLVTTNLQYNF
jgi:putative salt-induced outer membrane protein